MPEGHVYILGSTTGTLYTGVTSKFDQRLFEHKNGIKSAFATNYKCNRPLRRYPLRNRPRERIKGLDAREEAHPDLQNKPRVQRPRRATRLADTSPATKHGRPEIRSLSLSSNALAIACSCCHPERSEGSRNTPGRPYPSTLSATKFRLSLREGGNANADPYDPKTPFPPNLRK